MGLNPHTITSIAAFASVSPATVSRVMNHRGYVSSDMRAKVFAAAHHLGYRPRNSSGSYRIAILINDDQELSFNSYCSSMLFHLTRQCDEQNLTAEIFGVGSQYLLEEHFLQVGIVFQNFLTPAMLSAHPYTEFIAINLPTQGACSVSSDDRQGLGLAFDYLWERGHRRIGLVLPDSVSASVKLRSGLFCEKSLSYGVCSPQSLIVHLSPSFTENIAKFIRVQHPDALLIAGEDMLLQVNYSLSLLGISVPRDLSLISYENPYASALMVPPHTTVSQDFDHLARHAVQLALEHIEGNVSIVGRKVVVPNTLIERESVRSRLVLSPSEGASSGM